MVKGKSFSLLALELFWDESGKLEFQVHRRRKQLLNYFNKESTQKHSTFKDIPNEVLTILAKIISITEENYKMGIIENTLVT